MNETKIAYDSIVAKRSVLLDELRQLENNEMIKRYQNLIAENNALFNQQRKLYAQLKVERYASCAHILVCSKIAYDRYEGRSDKSYGCIKCGLDNSVLSEERTFLSFEGEIMYDFLDKHYLTGIDSKIICDLNLAKAIYSHIKQAHPTIDDQAALKYFQVALNKIRKKKEPENRKMQRAIRLSLDPNFKSWNSGDVEIS